MQIIEKNELTCQLCGTADAVRQIDWEKDGAAPIALCSTCRACLLAALANAAAEECGAARQVAPVMEALSPAAEAIRAEAATLSEAAFEEKYLPDAIDRVIFEYIHGYGEADMDGEGSGMVVLMMDGTASEQEVVDHLARLAARGVIYPIPGKAGWYGADYTFGDD